LQFFVQIDGETDTERQIDTHTDRTTTIHDSVSVAGTQVTN